MPRHLNQTQRQANIDGQRAVDATIAFANAVAETIPPEPAISQYVGVGDAEADAFADAVTGAIGDLVPTTFASMIVDMGKSLIQMKEERQKLDDKLVADLRQIDEDAEGQRTVVRLTYQMAATELGGRLQGVAKAMGA